MPIKTASCKNKGRRLQQWVRDRILEQYPTLSPDDVRSTSMGSSGEDVLLSPAARNLMPFSIECKAHASFAVYQHYKQAQGNSKQYEPLLIIKANREKPLAIVDADWLLNFIKEFNNARSN